MLRFYDTDHDTHSLQMDLSGGNFRFYKYTGSTDASHSEIFRVTTAGVVRFNNVYSFPSVDGTAGYHLQTDGAGAVTWEAGGGTVTGSGADNYVPRWNGTTALQDSSIYADDNGNVGIGTNVPKNLLHVKSGASGASTYDARYKCIVEGSGETYLGIFTPTYAGIRFADNTGTEGYIDYYMSEDSMRFSSTNHFRFQIGSSEKLRIISDGNVGIGTTSPDVKLHVFDTAPVSVEIESSTGNVDLTINSGTDGAVEKSSILLQANSVNKWELQKTNSGDFLIYDYGRSASVVDIALNGDMGLMANGGNVGIGTASPAVSLDILGQNIVREVLLVNYWYEAIEIIMLLLKRGFYLELNLTPLIIPIWVELKCLRRTRQMEIMMERWPL